MILNHNPEHLGMQVSPNNQNNSVLKENIIQGNNVNEILVVNLISNEVRDATGKLLFEKLGNVNENGLNEFDQFPTGIYFIRYHYSNNTYSTKKWLKAY